MSYLEAISDKRVDYLGLLLISINYLRISLAFGISYLILKTSLALAAFSIDKDSLSACVKTDLALQVLLFTEAIAYLYSFAHLYL